MMNSRSPTRNRNRRVAARVSWLVVMALALGIGAMQAQVASEAERASVALQVKALEGGKVQLSWPASPEEPARLSTTIYRRPFPPPRDFKGWGNPITVRLGWDKSYMDTPPSRASAWEYRVVTMEHGTGRTAYGYAVLAASGGAELDPTKAIGVVTMDVEPSPRLVKAWEAHGWSVVNIPISTLENFSGTKSTPEDVKGRILTTAQQLREVGVELKALLLLGDVPVPYSGNFAPDGHGDHWGAWPTDLYYGDLNGEWPDTRDFPPRAADPRQHNLAGDGKFDPNELPGPVEIAVGRVDFSRLTPLDLANGMSEEAAKNTRIERLNAWMERAADWHEGRYPVNGAEVLLHDLLADNPEAFATTPWRLAPLLSDHPEVPLRLPIQAGGELGRVLFGFGYAPGTFTSAMGISSSGELLSRRLGIPFVFLFGSYFGDWDAPGNLLQAALGNPSGGVLATSWAARPAWQLHPMAAGYTLGDCLVLTANRTQDYLPGLREAFPLHLALLGDPTMDLYPLPVAVREARGTSLQKRMVRWDPRQVENVLPHPPALKVEALGWHVFIWRQSQRDQTRLFPQRVTPELLPLATDHFNLPRGKDAPFPMGVQIRALYRLQTPAGPIERLGPGSVVRVAIIR